MYVAAVARDEARRNRDQATLMRVACMEDGKAFRRLEQALTQIIRE